MEIKEIFDFKYKAQVCNDILRSLPEWFAVEESIVDYTRKVQDMIFYIALEDTNPIGFIAVKTHNEFTAEISVMRIMSDFQRKGTGTSPIKRVEKFCID